MGGPIHIWECEVLGCRREPQEHYCVELCQTHWRRVSHKAFKTLGDAMTGFGKKDGMPAWEAAKAVVIAQAQAEEIHVEQIGLI